MGHAPVDPKAALAALDRAIDLGMNFFDTADIYGFGLAEKMLGKALTGRRDEAIICTKFGNREDARGNLYQDFSASWLSASVEGSLRRLRTDYLDILLLHGPSDDFDWDTFDRTPLDNLVQSGKIRAYGVSSHTVHGAESVLKSNFGEAIEVIFNALDRRVEEGLLELASNKNVGIISRFPLARGYLTKAYASKDPTFPENDYRRLMSEDERSWLLESARALSFLSQLPGGIVTSALRFCLSDPRVTVTIPGMHSVEQVETNFGAIKYGPLPKETLRRIAGAVPQTYSGWYGSRS